MDKQLYLAARDGKLAEVRRLLGAGAGTGWRGGNNDTPLHEASVRGHTDVVSALIHAGADVHAAGR